MALIRAEGDSSWGLAVVWQRNGHVVHVRINLLADGRLGGIPITLAGIYGASGSTQNTETR